MADEEYAKRPDDAMRVWDALAQKCGNEIKVFPAFPESPFHTFAHSIEALAFPESPFHETARMFAAAADAATLKHCGSV